jgi:large subunit ribosomal protein L21
MYAVIELQWHQYIVTQWDNIVVDKMEWKKWDKINIENILSVFDEKGESVLVWSPYLKNAKVSVEILDTRKWEKINVLKFKRKNRYKRNLWFRPHETVLEIKKIEING